MTVMVTVRGIEGVALGSRFSQIVSAFGGCFFTGYRVRPGMTAMVRGAV